jgi:opacity protein-like surface antigen
MRLRSVLLVLTSALVLAPDPGSAQRLADYDYENLTFRGIGFDYGYIWPNTVRPTPMWSVRLDLGYLGPAIRLAPTLSYWSSRFRTVQLDRFADRLSQLPALQQQGIVLTAADLGDIHWSNLSMSLDAHFVWTAPLNIIGFAGTGVSVHALNGRGDAIDGTFIEDLLDSTAAGAALLGGVELQVLPRLRAYGEARYTLVRDVRYSSLRIGGALMLPPQ